MANTTPTTKSPLQSKNLWSGVITILTAIFLGLGIKADAAAAAQLAEVGTDVAEQIANKNWLAAGIVLINSANILFHLFKTWFGNK